MDYVQLLFAAELRKVAIEVREEELNKNFSGSIYSGQQLAAAKADWKTQNTVDSFIKPALERIQRVAKAVDVMTAPSL